MSNFADWFSKIIVINLARRPDRWAHFQGEMEKIGVRSDQYERFEGYDRPADAAGYPDANPEEHFTNEKRYGFGNFGCTASHRGVLELIAHNKWARTLVLEDDCEVLDPKNFAALWAHIKTRIPEEWDLLYLGGQYLAYASQPHMAERIELLFLGDDLPFLECRAFSDDYNRETLAS